MEFTQEQLQILADRSEGWKAIWYLLWEALYERLHGMVINGSHNDPDSWSLSRQYGMLGDTSRAQDFVSDLLEDYRRRAELGTLLSHFEGGPEKLLAYLAAPSIIRGRALDFTARNSRLGITGMPSSGDEVPRIRDIDSDPVGGRPGRIDERSPSSAGLDVANLPVLIDWNVDASIDARVRMAALQCWPRLASDQPGRDRLEFDLRDRLHAEAPLDEIGTLHAQHGHARRRIIGKLVGIDQEIQAAPGMHAPRRRDLDDQRVMLQAALLLEPLTREQVQALLGLPSSDSAYQQLSRYRKAFAELFPQLQEHLERVGGGP
ncbi:MAG: hypothetical protein VX641_02050 [Planctomycetota bacterium]|nr:hypothetical protein [Planctomycetota bacterium]